MDVNAELIRALDFSDSIVLLTDVSGKIRYVNSSFCKKYGYTKPEVLGRTPRLFKSDYHDSIYYDQLWRTISNGETWVGEFKNITKSGKIIWEKATISPVHNEQGERSGYIAVKEDITRERELKMQADQDRFFLDELFNNSPIGIAILKPVKTRNIVNDFLVLRANPSASNVLGKLGIVGLKLSQIIPDYKAELKRIRVMVDRKVSLEAHLKALGKFVRYRSFPIGDGKICLFFYDVSPYKQTIRALEASEERYFTLVEDAPAMISRFNKDGILTYVNDQYCKTFEINREQLLGRSIFDWFSDGEKERIWQIIKGLTPENPISVIEHRLMLNGGKVKWVRWLDRALLSSDGEIFEYQSVGMDLTQLKQTEIQLTEHRNKLDAIVNSTIAGIGVVNKQGRFVLVNERLQKMIGFDSKEEMYGFRHEEATLPDYKELVETKFSQLLKGEVDDYNIECPFYKKDGSIFWGDLHVSPIKDVNGEILEVIGIVTDITEKKEVQLKLKERENKLRELNVTKDKLFSIIAHDIRNPFNSIIGFSNILRNNLESYTKDETRLYVEQILVASENLYKLLDDLLLWAKSQLGQMTVSKRAFQLRSLISEAFESYSILAMNKQIQLSNSVEEDIEVYADLEMIRFVIRNLIHNGIKFTENNGDVRCEAFEHEDHWVLSIKDTGIGIQESKLKILFDINEFISTSGTSDEKGTGLGLHLSKDMIEKNGGLITVESEVGKGTEFKIYLPKCRKEDASN